MNEKKLNEFENSIFRKYYDDGLIDMLIGLFIVMWGVGIIVEQAIIISISPVFFVPAWMALRKYITIPRLGIIDFSPERKRWLKRAMTVLRILFTGTLFIGVGVFFALSTKNDLVLEYARMLGLLPIGFMFSIVLFISGYTFDLNRLHAYGVTIITVFILCWKFGAAAPYYFFISGGLVLLAGVVLILQFMSNNPVVEGGAHEER